MFGPKLIQTGLLSLALTLGIALQAPTQEMAKPSNPTVKVAAVNNRGTLHIVAVGVSDSKTPENIVLGGEANVDAVVAAFEAQQGKMCHEVRIHKLTGRNATAARIRTTLDTLREDVKPGDFVVVYLNGHGGEIRGQWCMAATDAGCFRILGLVSRDELRSRLEKLPAPVLLLLDSCHSGAFGDGTGNRAVKGEAGLVVFCACLADQYGINSLKVRRSLFSLALVEALSGKADANGDGIVTLAEVDAYVAGRLPELEQDLGPDETQRQMLQKVLGRPLPSQTPTCSRPSTIASGLPLALITGEDA